MSNNDPASSEHRRRKEVMQRVRDLCGEHFDHFVFIGAFPLADEDGTVTMHTWDGDFNHAIGLSHRMEERMRNEILETDFPVDPTPGDEWQES